MRLVRALNLSPWPPLHWMERGNGGEVCQPASRSFLVAIHPEFGSGSAGLGTAGPTRRGFGQHALALAPTILRYAFSWLVLLAIAVTGCVTKSAANAQAQQAYVAGQRQALERMLQSRNSVNILGPVRNPLVPWTEDLTLGKAIVAAEYYPKTNPREILIVRQGRALPVDVNKLLAGEDVPLQAGDVVNIR